MRTTITVNKENLDELIAEIKEKNKSKAVRIAIEEYLKRKRIERILSMKGKLKFDLTEKDLRHYEKR